jgi:hypothetical protein
MRSCFAQSLSNLVSLCEKAKQAAARALSINSFSNDLDPAALA